MVEGQHFNIPGLGVAGRLHLSPVESTPWWWVNMDSVHDDCLIFMIVAIRDV